MYKKLLQITNFQVLNYKKLNNIKSILSLILQKCYSFLCENISWLLHLNNNSNVNLFTIKNKVWFIQIYQYQLNVKLYKEFHVSQLVQYF